MDDVKLRVASTYRAPLARVGSFVQRRRGARALDGFAAHTPRGAATNPQGCLSWWDKREGPIDLGLGTILYGSKVAPRAGGRAARVKGPPREGLHRNTRADRQAAVRSVAANEQWGRSGRSPRRRDVKAAVQEELTDWGSSALQTVAERRRRPIGGGG